MLIFKVAKFVLKHPLLTHGARQLVHKKLRPPKEASPMKQKVRGHAFRLVGLILGIIGATVSITSIVFAALGPASGTPGASIVRKGKISDEIHEGRNAEQGRPHPAQA